MRALLGFFFIGLGLVAAGCGMGASQTPPVVGCDGPCPCDLGLVLDRYARQPSAARTHQPAAVVRRGARRRPRTFRFRGAAGGDSSGEGPAPIAGDRSGGPGDVRIVARGLHLFQRSGLEPPRTVRVRALEPGRRAIPARPIVRSGSHVGVPDREGQHGRGQGPGAGSLRPSDPARGGELPDLGPADAGGLHPRARARQAGGGASQRRPRTARAADGEGHRAGRGGGRERSLGRRVPDRRVPDRERHQHQHERQRGDRPPRQRRARPAGSPERPRQRRPVLERQRPDGDAAGGGNRDRGRPSAGDRAPARRPPGKVDRVPRGREDRPHPPPGCDPHPARPGVRGLRGSDGRCRATPPCRS